MATFVKLTRADKPQTAVFVNLDRILWLRRVPSSGETRFSTPRPEHTQVWFGASGDGSVDACDFVDVLETPEDILYPTDPITPGGR